jgi:hypothetical protein
MMENDEESVLLHAQQSCEAILRESYEEAFSLLKRDLSEAKLKFAGDRRLVRLIVEVLGVVVILEGSLKQALADHWENEVSPREKREEVCSFCGKARSEVFNMVAGSSGFICNECIKLCSEIVAKAEE